MAAYYANELVFECPSELKDKTHHIFALSDDGPSVFNVVISRNSIAIEETLQTYGARLIKELQSALPQFRLLGRDETVVAGERALRLEFRWVMQGTPMRQTQISFFHTLEYDRRQVIQIAGTVTDGLAEPWDQVFENIIASIRLRTPEAELPFADEPYSPRRDY
jgi:hypothetical protein